MLLRLRGVIAGYGGGDVLQGVDIEIAAGLDRLHRRAQRRRQVDRAAARSAGCCVPREGDVMLDGDELHRLSPAQILAAGVSQVPAVRRAVPEHHACARTC